MVGPSPWSPAARQVVGDGGAGGRWWCGGVPWREVGGVVGFEGEWWAAVGGGVGFSVGGVQNKVWVCRIRS